MGISIALAWAMSLGRYEILYPSNSPCIVFRSGGCQLMNKDVLDVLCAAVTRGFPDGPEIEKNHYDEIFGFPYYHKIQRLKFEVVLFEL